MSKKIIPEEFIKRAHFIHNNKYNYKLIPKIFNNNKDKIPIICPVHGIFWQIIQNHLRGQGCPECKREKTIRMNQERKITPNKFIKRANKIHGSFYDYSLIPKEFNNNKDEIPIICPIHGVFYQVISKHLRGQNCPECSKIKATEKRTKPLEQFIIDAHKVWGSLYNYNNFKYKGRKKKGSITCPIHGDFEQTPREHLSGCGCPYCNESHGEREVTNYLTEHNIRFEKQKKFSDCKLINPLPFDFYLPELNTCIEYDGIQHFKIVKHFGGENHFKITQKRDYIKNQYCLKNHIRIIRIKYIENVNNILDLYFKNYKTT